MDPLVLHGLLPEPARTTQGWRAMIHDEVRLLAATDPQVTARMAGAGNTEITYWYDSPPKDRACAEIHRTREPLEALAVLIRLVIRTYPEFAFFSASSSIPPADILFAPLVSMGLSAHDKARLAQAGHKLRHTISSGEPDPAQRGRQS